MERPKIEYPCEWTYTIIGWDEEDLRLVVGRLVGDRPHSLRFSRHSSAGKYLSMHLALRVESEDDRNRLFVALQNDPQIKTVL